MKLAPTLNSWRPRFHVKSSRNWYLCCSVFWGLFTLWPMVTPPGKVSVGSFERSTIEFLKYEYWKTNSLIFPLPSTEFRFAFTEWNLLRLSPQFSGGDCGLAP